jgi:hypothetical protein
VSSPYVSPADALLLNQRVLQHPQLLVGPTGLRCPIRGPQTFAWAATSTSASPLTRNVRALADKLDRTLAPESPGQPGDRSSPVMTASAKRLTQ